MSGQCSPSSASTGSIPPCTELAGAGAAFCLARTPHVRELTGLWLSQPCLRKGFCAELLGCGACGSWRSRANRAPPSSQIFLKFTSPHSPLDAKGRGSVYMQPLLCSTWSPSLAEGASHVFTHFCGGGFSPSAEPGSDSPENGC